jgi:hypothetical protein
VAARHSAATHHRRPPTVRSNCMVQQ